MDQDSSCSLFQQCGSGLLPLQSGARRGPIQRGGEGDGGALIHTAEAARSPQGWVHLHRQPEVPLSLLLRALWPTSREYSRHGGGRQLDWNQRTEEMARRRRRWSLQPC
ncbi:hypothetical protein EJB05_03783 [Eragrostis curvula]|uniref:Uncharacterized protein n=1 Tax=Eragrostis curvula TaxID=38414 RepID=A0A5J9W8T9_9POAL|nr:hypothetical protein EJB05_03783 [Eragrostis curvula]